MLVNTTFLTRLHLKRILIYVHTISNIEHQNVGSSMAPKSVYPIMIKYTRRSDEDETHEVG